MILICKQVVLHSKHAKENALFEADLKKQTSAPIVIPGKDKNGVLYLDTALKIPSQFERVNNARVNTANVSAKAAVPTAGFRYYHF